MPELLALLADGSSSATISWTVVASVLIALLIAAAILFVLRGGWRR